MADSIETLLPKPDVVTHFETTIDAPTERVYQAARAVPMMRVDLARRLLWLRALPAQMDRKASSEDSSSFLLLREEGNHEVVWGMAGHFWHPSRNIIRLSDSKAWLRYTEAGSAKAAINFVVEELTGGKSRLSTETRIVCFGSGARRTFKLYWLLVGWFSGWIRRSWLAEVKRSVGATKPVSASEVKV
jgi:hypothetical protein